MNVTKQKKIKLPSFILIGEQKCGTGWIRDRLREHPEIHMAAKELNFFSNKKLYSKGIEYYSKNFAKSKKKIIGEKSPEYFWQNSGLGHYNQNIFEKIKNDVPDAKILIVLRNPSSRAVSALMHHTRHRGKRIHPSIIKNYTVSEILMSNIYNDYKHLGILERGIYSSRVEMAKNIFKEKLQVLIFEDDIVCDPRKGLDKICKHIGASRFENFNYKNNNKSQKPSYPSMILSHYLVPLRPLIRRFDNFDPFYPRLTNNCKNKLDEFYKEDIESLNKILDYDLLKIWRVG
jgi:hypothetical protein